MNTKWHTEFGQIVCSRVYDPFPAIADLRVSGRSLAPDVALQSLPEGPGCLYWFSKTMGSQVRVTDYLLRANNSIMQTLILKGQVLHVLIRNIWSERLTWMDVQLQSWLAEFTKLLPATLKESCKLISQSTRAQHRIIILSHLFICWSKNSCGRYPLKMFQRSWFNFSVLH